MRCSLFVPADQPPGRRRTRAAISAESQAIAAEHAAFHTIWLAQQWISTPPRLPLALSAAGGHFGRTDIDLPWERTNRVEALRKAARR